jgi:hypothetical protein
LIVHQIGLICSIHEGKQGKTTDDSQAKLEEKIMDLDQKI